MHVLLPWDPISQLLRPLLGDVRTEQLQALVSPPSILPVLPGKTVSREHVALALAMLLFSDVMDRVPWGRAYAHECAEAGQPLVFDHGGVRTVAAPSGALPQGVSAIVRILEPLGYEVVGRYPLPALRMTGYAYAHRNHPESLPQYFVSELHPERFSPAFRASVSRILSSSVDPLWGSASRTLARLAALGSLPVAEAIELLPNLVTAFGRQHADPALADYEAVLRESDEMAWISTEGQAFNHATDRVLDVASVCETQKTLGRPVKSEIAISRSGRVRQSAFQATPVRRLFRMEDGRRIEREVPGSFWEFISRERLPSGELDLSFDAGNATEIFAMTAAERPSARLA